MAPALKKEEVAEASDSKTDILTMMKILKEEIDKVIKLMDSRLQASE